MAITDHIAILTLSALDAPQRSRKFPEQPPKFYSTLAFPPAALDDLVALCKDVAPGGSLQGLALPPKLNSQLAQPLPGIPGDWYVASANNSFAPYLANTAGVRLLQEKDAEAIRSEFYAGRKVRAAIRAYLWGNRGGISFSLDGLMAVEGGDRLAIGHATDAAANAFAAYAQPGTASTASTADAGAGAGANPFGAPPAAAPSNSNPFQQNAAAANPFAQV